MNADQVDLTQLTNDSAGLPTSMEVGWNWDKLNWSGGNTGDACALFDTDVSGDAGFGDVDFALCVTIQDPDGNGPLPVALLSYRLYSCGDDRSDRCTQPVDEILNPSSTCSVAVSADDPFGPLAPNGPGEAYPFDVKASCHVVMADFGDPATLVNTCSYHSQEPNSDPEDCVLIPRDGFLQIVKVATPDDSSAEFDFTIDSRPTPDFTAHGSETSLLLPIAAGTHSIAEALPDNWQLDSVSCEKQSGTATGTKSGNSVTGVATESDKTTTCTFNNSLQAGTLLVKKHVVNDNGGLLDASDFSLHVKQDDTDVDTSPQDGSETGTTYTLIVGDYVVSEDTPPSGYTETGFSGDCDSTGTVTVAAGEEATCTITNDDIAPKLHLRKVVTKDNGGTALATAWTLNADGTGSNDLSGSTPVDSGATLQSDTWTLSESGGPSGYSPSDWSCVGGSQGTGTDKDKITVGIGGEATCTITNDDIAPKLHLRKVVTKDNGGTALATAWTLNADGTGTNDLSGSTPVDSGATLQSDTWTCLSPAAPPATAPPTGPASAAARAPAPTRTRSRSASVARPPARSPTTTSHPSCTCERKSPRTTAAQPSPQPGR